MKLYTTHQHPTLRLITEGGKYVFEERKYLFGIIPFWVLLEDLGYFNNGLEAVTLATTYLQRIGGGYIIYHGRCWNLKGKR